MLVFRFDPAIRCGPCANLSNNIKYVKQQISLYMYVPKQYDCMLFISEDKYMSLFTCLDFFAWYL